MVQSKKRKILNFTAFLFPALFFYILFFITPFAQGIKISLTNWDGLTPKAPVSIDVNTFENQILKNIPQKNKNELLSVYTKNESQHTYSRIALSGFKRWRIENIIRKAGFQPENNMFVGLDNYKKILTGKVSEDFYPHTYTEIKYNKTSELPPSISEEDFKNDIARKLNAEQKQLFTKFYAFDTAEKTYQLQDEWDEFDLETPFWDLTENSGGKEITEDAVDAVISDITGASLDQDAGNFNTVVDNFIQDNELDKDSAAAITAAAGKLYELGKIKNLLGSAWVNKKTTMGVVGFTIFFAVFSVIGINLLAFALALALDTNIKGKKILRSVFFLPNVLSMVIVALIWSMLFVQLLPSITGIEKWISDSAKTPWLLVLVAVWQGCGYYMIVYLAGLQNIPTEVIEAAVIDGASPWQKFKSITLPLMVPSMTVSLFLTIANALKSFDLIYAMIGSTGYATGTVPFVMDIYFDAFARKQAGLATAKAMLLFVVIFAVTGIQLILMKRKEIEQ